MAESKILFQGGVSNVLFTDRREFYPEPNEVHEYFKNLTPWLTWLMSLNVKPVPDSLYKIFEDAPTFQNQYFYNNGSALTIASNGDESAAITVDNITNLTQDSTANDSLINLIVEVWDSTGTTKRGQAFISDVASTTTLKMKTLKATAIVTADNDIYRVIGTVRGERSVAGESYFNEISVRWNSTHYFSLPVEITGKLFKAAKAMRGSDEVGRLRGKKLKEFKYQVQNGLLKSTSTVGTNFNGSDTFTEANLRTTTDSESNTSSVRTTYGYIPLLEDYGTTWNGSGAINSNTNIFKISPSSFDFELLTDVTKIIFDKREPGDIIFAPCGFEFLANVNKKIMQKDAFGFAGKVELSGEKINGLGFNVRNFLTPFGTIQLMPTKMLDNEYGNTCLLPNANEIGIKEFEPWQYKTNIKTDNDYNGVKDIWNYDAGFWMSLLPTHHMIQFVN